MYFGNNNMNNDLILSVLRHIFHRDCTIDDICKMNPSLLQTIMADIEYLSNIPINAISSKEFINDSPKTKIISVLKHVQTTFMHHPEDICRYMYARLNDRLTDIIKKSTIEHDIFMAYLLKYIIKEISVNGMRYSWKDKLEAFYYICGNMRYVEAASIRIKQSRYQSVDLITSLNHVRQLTKRKPLMDIIRDYIY